MNVDTAGLGDGLSQIGDVLGTAGIPPSKLGAARSSRLSEPERHLYFWILRRFAAGGRPSNAETRHAAGELGLDAESALGTFAAQDLVHLDRSGEIDVAYPFSGRPTAHRVRFPSGHEAYAMCAIDALGLAPMFEQPIGVASRDPRDGRDIAVHLTPSGDAGWTPEPAVVLAGAIDRRGASCQSCCPVLNFFASAESAEGWLDEHPHVRGRTITMQEAILAGRAVFGEVLTEAP